MKTQQHIVQDYYGLSYYIEQGGGEDLTIFVVDDNKLYLSMLKEALTRENTTVYAFSSGEECLEYMLLKPDLVILDFHLDGLNPYAKNGDEISKAILRIKEDTEIIIISSDEKFKLMSDLKLPSRNNLIYKDEKTVDRLKEEVVDSETKMIIIDNRKHNLTIGVITLALLSLITLFIAML